MGAVYLYREAGRLHMVYAYEHMDEPLAQIP